MYSVVMATMLAAGSTTPAWHARCHSYCHSCYSSCYSCYSGYGGYGGYCSSYCSSCWCSSCYCSRSYGCYSSCYSSCYCSSYCSSCYCSGAVYYSGCYCSTCSVCCSASVTQPRVVEVPPKKSEKVDPPKPKQRENKEEEVDVPTTQRSRVNITAPAGARVWVDNVECPRSFDTPALDTGRQYVYNFRMQVVRDGQTVSQTQRAVITPGQPVNVDFSGGTAVVSR